MKRIFWEFIFIKPNFGVYHQSCSKVDVAKMTVLISGNSFVFSKSDICIYCQGPAGTRGPEGRQGEKGTKVTAASVLIHVHKDRFFSHTLLRAVFTIISRETQVLLGPQAKQALWVHRECQENLEQKALEGSQDQWFVNSLTCICLMPNAPGGHRLLSFFLLQGEQGSPGPAGQKGPPGPIVSWQCLHGFIYLH